MKMEMDKNILNDIHSRLNETVVDQVFEPKSIQDIVNIIHRASKEKKSISLSGGKHAMGGQQFGQGTFHISMSKMNKVLDFDQERGVVQVQSGIEWPTLIEYLIEAQKNCSKQWGIVQKQTGADRLSLGGALAANIHGRGVNFKPIIQDVKSFELIDADGKILTVSRNENEKLFKLIIGGYGLFGIVATIKLRLQERMKLQRVVEIIPIDQLPEKARNRMDEGFLYGDFQYKTDNAADDFMQVGVFSTYLPVPIETPIEIKQRLTSELWNKFVLLAHTDKARAFMFYCDYYKGTNGQVYWSDLHQLSYYNDSYIEYLEDNMSQSPGTLMITEAYVPREHLTQFINELAQDAKKFKFNIIYGTMRIIKRDDESFLAWAKDDYACIIFNLSVDHSEGGIDKAKHDFQSIIDRALARDGSYFLTYHRWARKDQLLKAYPQFPQFLNLKLKYDPEERFMSDWYCYHKELLKDEIEFIRLHED